jgi:hypothetical protein
MPSVMLWGECWFADEPHTRRHEHGQLVSEPLPIWRRVDWYATSTMQPTSREIMYLNVIIWCHLCHPVVTTTRGRAPQPHCLEVKQLTGLEGGPRNLFVLIILLYSTHAACHSTFNIVLCARCEWIRSVWLPPLASLQAQRVEHHASRPCQHAKQPLSTGMYSSLPTVTNLLPASIIVWQQHIPVATTVKSHYVQNSTPHALSQVTQQSLLLTSSKTTDWPLTGATRTVPPWLHRQQASNSTRWE